ncbi:HAMP domain-containing histidine kinase [Proteobacteria bacterium 005FR1]|nr:HAMP domain-containing histidine kinase [Proteobacteria bacterium 005FR1]
MKLRTAVGIFIAISFALFLALAASLFRVSELLDRSARDVALAGEGIRIGEELKSTLLTHNRNAFLYSLRGEPWRVDTRREQRREIINILANLRLVTASPEEERIVTELRDQVQIYFDQRRALAEAGVSPLAEYLQISDYVNGVVVEVDRLTALNSARMNLVMAEIDERNALANDLAILLLSLSAGLLLALMAAAYFFAARPLSRLAASVESYGKGESGARVRPTGLTELKEIGASFNAMAERLEQRRQDQLRFVASIAHDLRNPLHSIRLAAEVLTHKIGASGDGGGERELSEMLRRQIRSLDLMLQDLLDTSRIEAGHLDLIRTVRDIRPLVQDAVDLHRSSAELHELILDLPDAPVLCHCDPLRCSQVMNNLLSNAIKYSPNGGVITVRVESGGDNVEISVHDQGIGIDPADLSSIFKPFQRSAATRETIPGIGLGLSVSRRIVEAHGGRLEVISVPGEGSTFTIQLPRAQAEAQMPPLREPLQRPGSERDVRH